jgi:hypothetical protein
VYTTHLTLKRHVHLKITAKSGEENILHSSQYLFPGSTEVDKPQYVNAFIGNGDSKPTLETLSPEEAVLRWAREEAKVIDAHVARIMLVASLSI